MDSDTAISPFLQESSPKDCISKKQAELLDNSKMHIQGQESELSDQEEGKDSDDESYNQAEDSSCSVRYKNTHMGEDQEIASQMAKSKYESKIQEWTANTEMFPSSIDSTVHSPSSPLADLIVNEAKQIEETITTAKKGFKSVVEDDTCFSPLAISNDISEAPVTPSTRVDSALADLEKWSAMDQRLLEELGIAEANLDAEQHQVNNEILNKLQTRCDQLLLRALQAEGRAAIVSESLARLQSKEEATSLFERMFSTHEKRMEGAMLKSVSSALEAVTGALTVSQENTNRILLLGEHQLAQHHNQVEGNAISSPNDTSLDENEELRVRVKALEADLVAKTKEAQELSHRESVLTQKLREAELVSGNARLEYESAVRDLREDMQLRLAERKSADAVRIGALEEEMSSLNLLLQAKDETIYNLREELLRVDSESKGAIESKNAVITRLQKENENFEHSLDDAKLELARIKVDLATRRSDEDDLLARLAAFQASQMAAMSPPSSPRPSRSTSSYTASITAWLRGGGSSSALDGHEVDHEDQPDSRHSSQTF